MAVKTRRRVTHGRRHKPRFNGKIALAPPTNRVRAFQKPPKSVKGDGESSGKPIVVPHPGQALVVDQMPVTLHRERSSYDGDSAIKLYLREIGQVRLLTPEEEIES